MPENRQAAVDAAAACTGERRWGIRVRPEDPAGDGIRGDHHVGWLHRVEHAIDNESGRLVF
jgi:hypothetical protein